MNGLMDAMKNADKGRENEEMKREDEKEEMIEKVTEKMIDKILEEFQVGRKNGFLGDELPLKRLREENHEEWEKVMDQLSVLLHTEKKILYQKIENLPDFKVEELIERADKREMRRAFLVLSFLSHAYVFADSSFIPLSSYAHPTSTCPPSYTPQQTQTFPQKLPAVLAKSWVKLASHLQIKPILTHFSLVICNWGLFDERESATLPNLFCNALFLGGIDEAWFYLVPMEMEAAGGRAIREILSTHISLRTNSFLLSSNSSSQQVQVVKDCLRVVREVIEELTFLLKRMRERCDPHCFYKRVRPFLSGWKNNEKFPNGLVYEGCEGETAQFFHGGSAAQSPLIQTLDAFLGVSHKNQVDDENFKHDTPNFLMEMREYMLGKHKRFIEFVSEGPSVRDFVSSQTNEELLELYNGCVKAMSGFRSYHIGIVQSYILSQTPNSSSLHNEDQNEVRGTGGSKLIPLLKQCRKETDDVQIIAKEEGNK